MRVACLERLGSVREALGEAEELRREDASTETLVRFALLCTRFGDMHRAVLAGQDLLLREDIKPEDAIAVAEVLMVHAPDLSKNLLLGTNFSSIHSEQLPSAVGLGFRLELEREMVSLLQRGAELAKQGSEIVKQFRQEEFATLFEQQRRTQVDLIDAYERGHIAIHRLVDDFRLNLVGAYWGGNDKAFSPLSQPHAMIRHGRRCSQTQPPILPMSTQLNMDITSLLMAHRFGLWKALQSGFSQIRISRHVIPFLQHALHWTGTAQPGWERGQREVVQLWREGLIDTDISNADCAVQLNPPSDASSDMNPRFVADELRTRGVLSSSDHERALEALGTYGSVAAAGFLSEDSRRIYCGGTTSVLFA